jgi:DNA replication protein DnaC
LGNLLDSIKQEPVSAKINNNMKNCILSSQVCSDCSGSGVNIKIKGINPRAEICKCIYKCKKCLGNCQNVQLENTIKPCKEPPPSKICGFYNNASIPARYIHSDLNDFANNTGNTLRISQAILEWQKVFLNGKEKRGFILNGSVGIGKTFILSAIAKSLIFSGRAVKFVDFFQLISEIKAGYASYKSDQDILAPLLKVDILIIDELGKGRNTDFELTILDQLIMGRYNQNKTLLASTNFSLKYSSNNHHSQQKKTYYTDFESPNEQDSYRGFAPVEFGPLELRVGKRIFSRLIETTIFFEMNGDDYRKKKAKT